MNSMDAPFICQHAFPHYRDTATWLDGFLEHADQVLLDGQEVGVSSGTIYSYWFRETLAHGCIDSQLPEPGTELIVEWGDHGKRIKPVRVTVAPFPFLSEGRNSGVWQAAS